MSLKEFEVSATPLARGNEMLLAYMERVTKAADMAMEKGDYSEMHFGSQAMQCLHSELRLSAGVPHSVTNTFSPLPFSVGEVVTLTDENCSNLCARMVKMAREANRTSGASFSMDQLQGAEIALECLDIPYEVNFDPTVSKRTWIRVGKITMSVDIAKSGEE